MSEGESFEFLKSYECEICGKTFDIELGLQLHLCFNGDLDIFPIGFEDDHKLIHEPFSPKMNPESPELTAQTYACSKCQNHYSKKSDLEMHEVNGHAAMMSSVSEVRTGTSRFQDNLDRKTSTENTSKKLHVCQVCGQDFLLKSKLNAHERTHEKQCGICKKKFKRMWSLRDHMKIHSDEKPYECGICKTSFKKESYMRLHQRTHDKQLECPLCKKRFALKFQLRRHKRCRIDKKKTHRSGKFVFDAFSGEVDRIVTC